MTESTVNTQRSYVVTDAGTGDLTSVNTQRSYVVTDAGTGDFSNVNLQRAYVVTTPLAAGGLGRVEVAERPEYIVENGTPYVKFEPNTNNKKLLFIPLTEPALREIWPVKYWRFFSTKGARTRFADIYFQDESGVSIPGDYVAIGGSVYSTYYNANGVDGDPATLWISSGANGWVGKNFTDPQLVKKYRIEAVAFTTYTHENPSSWRIEFSYDGVTWIVADEVNLGRSMAPEEVYEGTLPASALTTAGNYEIIALRPNLLDFYESTQVFAGPAQVEAPHFNQLFMANRTLGDAERNQIKQSMLSRATGSGIDIEAYEGDNEIPVTVVNPSAEDGIAGWTASGGFTTRSGAVGETPGAIDGGNYFYGGASTASSNAYQDVDVGESAALIDAGAASFRVDWYQSHYAGDDKGNVRLVFFDAASTSVGSDAGPGLSAHTGGWLPRTTGNVSLPIGTRTVRITMEAVRFSGSNNDAYFDALSAKITSPMYSENSVPGGLKDPYILGVIGEPPPGGATLLDSTKYTGSGNISQAHVFAPSTTLAVVVVNNVMSTTANPITPVMTINGEAATREASTYYSTSFTEGAFAFSVPNPSSGDIVYAGGASESWMMTVYEFSNATVGIAVDQGAYTGQSGSPISTLSAAGNYVIHAITLGRQDGETVTSFSGGAFESHDPAGAYYTGASAIVEDASGTYSWSFTGGTDSYQYRVAIPILNA